MSGLTRVLTLMLCVFALSACSSPAEEAFSNGSPQLVATPDAVSAMLAEAADRASSALETLAAVEYSRKPSEIIEPIHNAPMELRRSITVNWVGPVEPIAKTLAERAGYNFQVMGGMPAVPVVVSIDVENKPVVEVLRDLGLQLGQRADVKVNASHKIVEIHYQSGAEFM